MKEENIDYGNDCIYYKKCKFNEYCCKQTSVLLISNKKLLEEHEMYIKKMTTRTKDWGYWDGWKIVYDIKNDSLYYKKTNDPIIRDTLLVAKGKSGSTAIIYRFKSVTSSNKVIESSVHIKKEYKEKFIKDITEVFEGLDSMEEQWNFHINKEKEVS